MNSNNANSKPFSNDVTNIFEPTASDNDCPDYVSSHEQDEECAKGVDGYNFNVLKSKNKKSSQ